MLPKRHQHNSKAWGFNAGTRKKGKLKKDKQEAKTDNVDPNAEIIATKSAQEKDSNRRDRLREELRAQSDNWSSKKRKRLEKYIDKKLKKDQRVLIFEKLAKSQDGVASSFLQSSSTLGTGKTFSHREHLEKHEDLQVRHAVQGKTGKRKRHSGITDFMDVVEGLSASDVEPDGGPQRTHVQLPLEDVQMPVLNLTRTNEAQKPLVAQPVVIGSALRRNDDGTIAIPVVRGKTTKTGVRKWENSCLQRTTIKNDSDTSFDSSDSAYDTTSEADDEKGTEKEAEPRNRDMQGEGEDTDSQESGSTSDDNKKGEQFQKTNKMGFKAWATKQLSLAKGYIADPTNKNEAPLQPIPVPLERATKRRKIDETEKMRGPMGEELVLPSSTFAQQVLKMESAKKSFMKRARINRPSDVEAARLLLPIVSEEQPIMEAIILNPVVIICGETGSGKTTQLPQFLYEAGFGNPGSENPGIIGITQPRRVAAISMATRVAHELSLTSSHVSYQVRYDATVSPSTSIKFMTDGVLLRELATDFLLSKYSVIIIDEAHERSINTDILIGVLSRIVKLREETWKKSKEGAKPLRLIIMSATLRVSDFLENRSLFPVQPPVINVATRQHPVTIHFSRRTSTDYLGEAVKKAFKIHARLPPGGILIFLTGQNEITGVCRRLEERYGRRALHKRRDQCDNRRTAPAQHTRQDYEIKAVINPSTADLEPEDIDLDTEDCAQHSVILHQTSGGESEDDIGSESDEDFDEELGFDTQETEVPMHIVPLYSLLSSEKQMEVFKPPPVDARLIVVATNVAETSLTIPGIKYVIDCGRVKERRYDVANGIQAFQVTWVSKASAAQRAGRAGRTGPGHCYRLYSSALFEHHFPQFNPPEILRAPIEGVVLQMKNMHIDAVVNFPFPTPPDRPALQRAEKLLLHLGALTKSTTVSSQSGPVISQVTDLGRTMALFPVSPRFARMLAAGQQHQCLPYIIAIVSAMSVGDPFLYEAVIGAENGEDMREHTDENLYSETNKAEESQRQRRKTYFQNQHAHASLGDYTSDVLKILSVVGAYEYQGGGVKFCSDNLIRHKAMEEIHKLRAQITSIVQLYFPAINVQFSPKLSPPSNMQIKVLKQLIAAAFIDQVAIRKDLIDHGRSLGGSQYSSSHGVPYRAAGVAEDVFLHPSSVLSERPPPDFVVFQEVVRTSRVFIKGVTVVNPAWLSSLGGSTLCSYSKPFRGSDGVLFVTPRFGPEGWELPAVKARKI